MFSHHLRDVARLLQQIRIPDVFIFHSSVSPLPPLTPSPLSTHQPLMSLQTLQMGIKHFSGLFVMLCVGVALSLLTTIAEHIVYKLVIPRVKEPRFKYWLHTSQVTPTPSLSHIHRHTDRERDITAISQEWERSTLKSEEISDYYHTDMWKQSEHKVCETCRECKVQVFPK